MLFTTPSFAQQNKNHQHRITVNEHKAPLEKVLNDICIQAGYDLMYSIKDFKGIRPVNIAVNDVTIEEAVKSALKGQPFTYSIDTGGVSIRLPQKTIRKTSDDPSATVTVIGLVADENNKGLKDVIITVNSTYQFTKTDKNGFFIIRKVNIKDKISITHPGYQPQEIKPASKSFHIKMIANSEQLKEVKITGIVSTGYQVIPKERATESFVLVDSSLFNRRVSTNVLDRLDGVTSGLIFNKNTVGNTPPISIRDRSTISANTNPLIILDNFPYDGDLSNINPQDVQSITILKDAAAASIWGSRAGNGVIVITTKTGLYNQKPVISFNSNVTIGAEPDQYYKQQLSNQEYIGVEQFLFDKGKFNGKINTGYAALSPAVEIMLLRRNNVITDAQKRTMLDSIAAHDNRADLNKYFNRQSINQQYQLSVNGGGEFNKYYLSTGYDKNLSNNVTNGFNRVTLNANNVLSLVKNKIELLTGIMFTSSNTQVRGAGYQPRYPYENVADQNGRPLAVTDGTLRLSYVDTVGKGRLLDWHYRPLDELNPANYSSDSKLTEYRINLGITYGIIKNLKFSINYTYDKGMTDFSEDNSAESSYTRNMVNTFTQVDKTTGTLTRPLPLGDIVTTNKSSYYAHYGRGQLNYKNEIAQKHAINIIAGYEVKDYQSSISYQTLYGYNKATATNQNAIINQLQDYTYYYNSGTSKIPLSIGNFGTIDRYVSYYANGSYTYDHKYIFSISARRDESNLFGVNTNQKGVPLASTGLAWNLSQEEFYHFKAFPRLKLRATYGYNGNVDKTTSAYLTTQIVNALNPWGQSILQINNPPNPSLRWEKVRNINFGADFGTKNNRITGSVDYWIKDGIDLIGQSPIAQQTGISIFKGNSANMESKGIDLTLNTININSTKFKWMTVFLFNYNTDKITSYKVQQGTNTDIVRANYISPMVGSSYYSIFSYKWMGLDKAGNPQGMLNGKISEDYAAISSSKNVSDLVYSGTLNPKYYGSVRNTFTYGPWELSANIIYKLGYSFRRSSLNNFQLYLGNGGASSFQQADYGLRWQKPGDELTTNVPSLIFPAKQNRDDIYTYSDILVEKADHVRLQDIKLNYQLKGEKFKKSPFSTLDLYLYLYNLGILWKATSQKLDPDYPYGAPQPRTVSIGIKANLK